MIILLSNVSSISIIGEQFFDLIYSINDFNKIFTLHKTTFFDKPIDLSIILRYNERNKISPIMLIVEIFREHSSVTQMLSFFYKILIPSPLFANTSIITFPNGSSSLFYGLEDYEHIY